jgi:quinoprotein glucose dehydrogenase
VEWGVYGGDPGGSKYSPADDVTAQNVQRLKIVWQWEHGEQPIKEYNTTPYRFENQPLMVDGVLYVTTPYNNAAALDAEMGKELWRFESGAVKLGEIPGTGFKHRGAMLWRDAQAGNALRVLLNTRTELYSLDARTGSRSLHSEGRRRLAGRRYPDPSPTSGMSITAARPASSIATSSSSAALGPIATR